MSLIYISSAPEKISKLFDVSISKATEKQSNHDKLGLNYYVSKMENSTIKMDEICESYKKLKIEMSSCKMDAESKEKWEYYTPILTTIEEFMSKTQVENSEYLKLSTMLATVYYEQARIFISKNDSRAAVNLKKSIQLIKDHKTDPNMTYIYLRIVNLYSYFQAKSNCLEEAKELLLDAEKLYQSIVKEKVMVFNMDDLFKSPDTLSCNVGKFEKLVTNNLQMLGWIYNKQNLLDTFVVYHHMVLRRQLEQQDGSALAWVIKCARLSSYFLSKQRFHEARHHLAAALHVLQEYEKELHDYKDDPDFSEEWEEYQHYYADVARYWVKYGLFLFNASRTQNMKNTDSDVIDTNDKGDSSDDPLKNPENLVFPTINVEHIENQVTDELVKTSEQARTLFIHSQVWLKRSKQFYTVHEHTLDYVNSILDLSELYRYIAFYEEDIEGQYNVQKRRADVLETLSNILKEVRPQCYVAVGIELFRELAEVQLELLALSMQKLYQMDTNIVAQNMAVVQDYNVRKMEAISDIHSRLELFHDRIKLTK